MRVYAVSVAGVKTRAQLRVTRVSEEAKGRSGVVSETRGRISSISKV